jgi:hypothetical protein
MESKYFLINLKLLKLSLVVSSTRPPPTLVENDSKPTVPTNLYMQIPLTRASGSKLVAQTRRAAIGNTFSLAVYVTKPPVNLCFTLVV